MLRRLRQPECMGKWRTFSSRVSIYELYGTRIARRHLQRGRSQQKGYSLRDFSWTVIPFPRGQVPKVNMQHAQQYLFCFKLLPQHRNMAVDPQLHYFYFNRALPRALKRNKDRNVIA